MNELIQALEQLQAEKGIDKEVIFEAIEASLVTACKKNFGTSQNVTVNMDRNKGTVRVLAWKNVVEEVTDPALEILVDEAVKINANYKVGDVCEIEVTPKNFGRIAAQNAKQVVVQKLREAERGIVYGEYKGKERDMVSGLIQRKEKGNVYLNLGKIEALLAPKEQIPGEPYAMNQRIKAYVLEVKNGQRGPMVMVSRTHPELIKRLFEQEVPEIHDGIVMIKSISREAGSRSKIAVYSKDPMVDPLGACVGPSGNRVNTIVHELAGEKIDIVIWNEEPARFIAAALSPAEVDRVEVDKEGFTATVVVPDHQLSLAIGKEGQNARLAARLTGYKIDIKSETQAAQEAEEEEYEYEYEFVEEDEDELTMDESIGEEE
ncbi:MAG: transcription termination/antitermination protein NusA [Lachnospiraceae bacterium]|jgi:N utilization substance protein A|nr:transcription termination/antitermination protein NusA [Lachnospiraceae bacterium]